MLGDPEPPSDRYADLPPVAVDVPDDARELARDLQALQRERRSARRRTWVQRHLPGRRWHRYGISAPLVVTALLFVALGTTLLAVLASGRPARPTPRPLASQVPVAPGTEGGLLPAVPLRFVDGPRDTRAVRPAVFVLLPADCYCQAQVRTAVGAAQEFALPAILVTGPRPPARRPLRWMTISGWPRRTPRLGSPCCWCAQTAWWCMWCATSRSTSGWSRWCRMLRRRTVRSAPNRNRFTRFDEQQRPPDQRPGLTPARSAGVS